MFTFRGDTSKGATLMAILMDGASPGFHKYEAPFRAAALGRSSRLLTGGLAGSSVTVATQGPLSLLPQAPPSVGLEAVCHVLRPAAHKLDLIFSSPVKIPSSSFHVKLPKWVCRAS